MNILSIESSCDETAAAVLNIDDKKIVVVCNVVSSQLGVHKEFGGVVPEVAARQHAELIHEVIAKAVEATPAGDGSDIDLIAVTRGPGLKTSLLVGITAAEALGLAWNKPVVGVNHLEGHILSPLIEHDEYPLKKSDFPIIVLTASGGHTQIVLMKALGEYEVIGSTIDDAAGEAFDKVGKMLGLGYPGGAAVDKLADDGNPQAFDFPRPMLDSGDYRFSFSGLKTAVKYMIANLTEEQPKMKAKERRHANIKEPPEYRLSDKHKADIAASFQRAVIDVLIIKTMRAAKEYRAKTVFLAGGVGACQPLRSRLEESVKEVLPDAKTVLIDRRYSGDNAAMIGLAGYFEYLRQNKKPPVIEVDPKLGI